MRAIREGYVPNQPIREAFLRSGLTTYDVALFCKWVKGKQKSPDTTRVERYLGLKAMKGVRFNVSIAEHNALKIIEALNLDPVDFRDIGL